MSSAHFGSMLRSTSRPAALSLSAFARYSFLVVLLATAMPGVTHAQTIANPAPVNLGSQAVNTAQAQTTVTFTVSAAGTLAANPLVLNQGAASSSLDFTLGTGSTCKGAASVGTCTVNVVFTPKAAGQRVGAVQLTNSAGTAVIATALLYGTGTGPTVAFPGHTTASSLGSGFSDAEGIAVDAAGNVYVADTTGGVVKEIVAVNGIIPATNPTIKTLGSGFVAPAGVAVDGAGNVYVADQDKGIKEIVAVGGVTSSTSLMKTLNTTFSTATDVAVDGSGNVYVADNGGSANGSVGELIAVNGSITASPTAAPKTLGSGFISPGSIAVDAAGNVYIADNYAAVKEIVAVNGSTSSTSTVRMLGSGFSSPSGIRVDGAGNVYVSDGGNGTIKELLAVSGSVTDSPTILTLGTGFGDLQNLAVDAAGNVFVVIENTNVIYEVPLATPPALSFASTAVTQTSTDSPKTLVLQNIGNTNLTFATPASGTNPALSQNYTLSNSSTCPQSTPSTFTPQVLAPGTCTAVISFSPVIKSSANGTLVFTDDSGSAAGSTQTVTLIGTSTTGTTAQTITFPQPTTPALSGTSVTLTASSNSSLPVTLSVIGGPATLSGSTVTYTGVGTVVLEADQNGNGTYAPATAVQRTVTVRLQNTITFPQPTTPVLAGSSANLLASADSGLPITYTVVSGPATLNGSTVTYTAAGTVVLQAAQAGNTTYAAAASVQRTVTVQLRTNTITFPQPTTPVLAGTSATLAAASSSGLPVTYTLVSGPATLSGSAVSYTGAGTVVLQADQAGNGTYAPAASVQRTVTVKLQNTITFPQPPTPAVTRTSQTLTASADSGLPVTYSVVSGPASMSGSTVTYLSTGTVVIQADQAGNGTYVPAASVQRTVSVRLQNTLAFPQPPTSVVAGTSFNLVGSASSNLPVTFSVVSGPATVSGSAVFFTGAGTVVLEADQAGNASYVPAAPIQTTVTAQSPLSTALEVTSAVQTATIRISIAGTGSRFSTTSGYTVTDPGTCTSAYYNVNDTCTVSYTYKPRVPGLFPGTLQFTDSNQGVLGSAQVLATGVGPVMVFPSTAPAALNLNFVLPNAVAIDSSGYVYEASQADGVKLILGSSSSSVASGFSSPAGLAGDGAGNLYVADRGSNLIQEIVPKSGYLQGPQSTVLTLGSGFSAPSGVAVDASGNVYVADTGNNAIKEIVAVERSIPSNPTILTLGSGFSSPTGVAVDAAGNVYVADSGNNAIKEILAVGGNIPAPNPTILTLGSGFNKPYAVAIDAAGDVYVSDSGNNAMKEILAVGGSIPAGNPTILTLGSDFSSPQGVAVSSTGNVYVADSGNGVLQEFAFATLPLLKFDTIPVGSTSATQNVRVQNVGNGPLSLAIPSTGQNPSLSGSFSLSTSSNCPVTYSNSSSAATFAPGFLCTEVFSYNPTISGAAAGNLAFTDNIYDFVNIVPTSTQTIGLTGSTTSGLTMQVVDQTVPYGTGSVPLEFIVGWGGNKAPTGKPTLTVNGSNLGQVPCIAKAGHNNCTVYYYSLPLSPGAYTITATQPADSNYPQTTATGTLNITGTAGSHIAAPVRTALTPLQ